MAKIRPLPSDLQQIAIDDLNERTERIEEDLASFRVWIEQQPHLTCRTDDQFLIAFLRGCKYSLEKAKFKIDRYYSLKTKYPDFYTNINLNDNKILDIISYGIGLPLPIPLHGNGSRILLIRPGVFPTAKYTFADVLCVANTMQEITMREDDYAVVNGTIEVLDMSTVTTTHMFQMTPTVMKRMTVFGEEAVPLRQKASHFINMPLGADKILNMLKPVMPLKQQQRIFVHGTNLSTLYVHIPQKYLPIEYGGENGSIAELTKAGKSKFLEYRTYFAENSKFGTDEKRRIGKLPNYDDVFGNEGSFRKLNVD